jgi:hypothetical protein
LRTIEEMDSIVLLLIHARIRNGARQAEGANLVRGIDAPHSKFADRHGPS